MFFTSLRLQFTNSRQFLKYSNQPTLTPDTVNTFSDIRHHISPHSDVSFMNINWRSAYFFALHCCYMIVLLDHFTPSFSVRNLLTFFPTQKYIQECWFVILSMLKFHTFQRKKNICHEFSFAELLLICFHPHKNCAAHMLAFSCNWFLPPWSNREFTEAAHTGTEA